MRTTSKVGLVFGATWGAVAGVAFTAALTSPPPAEPDRLYGIHACRSDDGSGPRPCVWDAERMGDGNGTSFLVDRTGRKVRFGEPTQRPLEPYGGCKEGYSQGLPMPPECDGWTP